MQQRNTIPNSAGKKKSKARNMLKHCRDNFQLGGKDKLNLKLTVYLPTLTSAHACRPIFQFFNFSIFHAWMKNVSCCRLAWHNFQKYVNSDPCKERKPCVKWVNDNTFLAISDFVDKRFLDNFAFGRLRTSSKTSGFFGNLRKWSCRLQKSQHSQDKNLTLISHKKLAGILRYFLRLEKAGRSFQKFGSIKSRD